MSRYLKITIVDPDPDYLGIEICASSDRYSGSTRIFAGVREMSAFTSIIEGFPSGPEDCRSYEFGTNKPGYAGGYCLLKFRCIDKVGNAAIDLELEDWGGLYLAPDPGEASAKFSIHPIQASDVDRFINHLRAIEKTQSGKACLGCKG